MPNISQGSTLLEFYQRATLGYIQELAQSMAELSGVQKVTTPPAFLKKLDDFMQDPLIGLITKAVKIVRQLLKKICKSPPLQLPSKSNRYKTRRNISSELLMRHTISCWLFGEKKKIHQSN